VRPVLAVALVLGLLGAGGTHPAASGTLLQNGSFDESQGGRPVGWPVTGGSIASVEQPVAEPGLAARLSADQAASAAHVTQLLSLQRGATYSLSARLLVDDARVQVVRLQIGWFEANGSPRTRTAEVSNTDGVYQLVTAPVTTIPCDSTGSLASLVVLRHSNGAQAFVDDMRLELLGQTPCPTPTHPPTHPPPPTSPPGQLPRASATPPGATASPDIGPLRNGGFEQVADGALVAWRDHGGILSRVANPVHGGSHAGAFFSSSESTKWAYQTVAATPLAWYEFAAHVRMSDPRIEAAFLRVSWYSSADGSGSALDSVDSTGMLDSLSPAYRRLTTGSVQAPPGARSANVRVLLRPRSSSGATIYLDDASWRPASPAAGRSAADQASDGLTGDGSDGSGDDRYWSGVAGVSRGPINALGTPFPTPVLVREAATLPSESGSRSWWVWALAGAAALAVGVGAWSWHRRGRRSE
jgi:hypothetical protein